MPWKFKNVEGCRTFPNYWITAFYIDGVQFRMLQFYVITLSVSLSRVAFLLGSLVAFYIRLRQVRSSASGTFVPPVPLRSTGWSLIVESLCFLTEILQILCKRNERIFADRLTETLCNTKRKRNFLCVCNGVKVQLCSRLRWPLEFLIWWHGVDCLPILCQI